MTGGEGAATPVGFFFCVRGGEERAGLRGGRAVRLGLQSQQGLGLL